VGGLSQMKLTSFEKNCHILRRSLTTVQISKNSSTLKTAWPNRKHMENQNKIFKPRIEMPVISAIFFSGNENDQN
jgi:hypothetical protein